MATPGWSPVHWSKRATRNIDYMALYRTTSKAWGRAGYDQERAKGQSNQPTHWEIRTILAAGWDAMARSIRTK